MTTHCYFNEFLSLYIACYCNTAGTVNGSQYCDILGQCYCKANVEGRECSTCINGTYNLSSSDPNGCQGKCVCVCVLAL